MWVVIVVGVSGIEYFIKIFMNVCFCCLSGRTERIIINPIKVNGHKNISL